MRGRCAAGREADAAAPLAGEQPRPGRSEDLHLGFGTGERETMPARPRPSSSAPGTSAPRPARPIDASSTSGSTRRRLTGQEAARRGRSRPAPSASTSGCRPAYRMNARPVVSPDARRFGSVITSASAPSAATASDRSDQVEPRPWRRRRRTSGRAAAISEQATASPVPTTRLSQKIARQLHAGDHRPRRRAGRSPRPAPAPRRPRRAAARAGRPPRCRRPAPASRAPVRRRPRPAGSGPATMVTRS